MKIYDLSKFHIFSPISFHSNETMWLKNIPFETLNGYIRDASGVNFASIKYHSKHFEGGYGILVKALWNGNLCLLVRVLFILEV
jgi:hypothetical protein